MTKNESLRVWIFRSKLKFFCKKNSKKLNTRLCQNVINVFQTCLIVYDILSELSSSNHQPPFLKITTYDSYSAFDYLKLKYRFYTGFNNFLMIFSVQQQMNILNVKIYYYCVVQFHLKCFFFQFFSFYCNLLLRSCFVVVKVLC